MINSELRRLNDVCEVKDSLELAIGFLGSSGGKSDQLISEYLHDILCIPQERGLRSRRVRKGTVGVGLGRFIITISWIPSFWRKGVGMKYEAIHTSYPKRVVVGMTLTISHSEVAERTGTECEN